MSLPTFYFNVEYAIKIHDWIIEASGGLCGNHCVELLESVLCHIQNDDYYPTLQEKLKHLIYGIVKFHPFRDGNKRSSLVLGAYFLKINGYDYCIEAFMERMEEIIVWFAEGKIKDDLLLKILDSIINNDEFSEEIKFEIIESVGL